MPTTRIGNDTISRMTCIVLRPPMNISDIGNTASANAQNTRCQRAGSSPASRCRVAPDASEYDAES